MHRRPVSTIPVLVAAAMFVLTSSAFGAPQDHNHSAPAGSDHACACCGNSGAHTMNHAAEGGCCSKMGAESTAASADGNCCAERTTEASSGAPTANKAKGCCGSMAMAKGDGSATPTDHASMPVPQERQEQDGEEPPLE